MVLCTSLYIFVLYSVLVHRTIHSMRFVLEGWNGKQVIHGHDHGTIFLDSILLPYLAACSNSASQCLPLPSGRSFFSLSLTQHMSLRVACKYAYTAYIVSNIIHSIPIDWSVFTAVRPESVLTSALSSGGTCSRTRRDSARSDQLDRVGSRRLAEVDERQEEQAVASWQIKSCSIFCSRIQHEFCISTANNLKQVFASQISTYLNHASDFF
jgi:hypothetical protein